MRTKDKGRKWMWWFLAAGAALQVYFVQELLAAFAFFAIGFAAVAVAVFGVYLLQRSWEAGIARMAQPAGSVATIARRGLAYAEEMGRRTGSEPAQ